MSQSYWSVLWALEFDRKLLTPIGKAMLEKLDAPWGEDGRVSR